MSNNNTKTEYLRRIEKAKKFIVNNIDQAIKLDEIASVSHFSPFHFHRIFHAIEGETVNDFVIRKKMEKAAQTLVSNPQLSITVVAQMRGFSSSANFSKAFKLYFGLSPSQLRDPQFKSNSKIGKIFRKYGKAFDSQKLYSQFVTNNNVFDPDKLEEIFMNVKIVDMDEKVVNYMTAPGGYDLDSIFETWDKIINWAENSGIEDHQYKRFAICHDNPMITPVEKCRYDACVELEKSIDVGMRLKKSNIPSGKYAIGYYKGEGEKVSNFYMEMYSSWLANSGYEPDDFPPVAHYLNDSRLDGFVEMELMIKLKGLEITD